MWSLFLIIKITVTEGACGGVCINMCEKCQKIEINWPDPVYRQTDDQTSLRILNPFFIYLILDP